MPTQATLPSKLMLPTVYSTQYLNTLKCANWAILRFKWHSCGQHLQVSGLATQAALGFNPSCTQIKATHAVSGTHKSTPGNRCNACNKDAKTKIVSLASVYFSPKTVTLVGT